MFWKHVDHALIALGLVTAGLALGRGLGSTQAEPQLSAAVKGPGPRSLEATVFLPLADNDGRPFADDEWDRALVPLVTRFGGATLGAPQEGYWLGSDGRPRREPVRPVIVSFAPARLGEFRAAAHEVGRRLRQEAVYVRFHEPCVELLPVAGRRPAAD